MDSLLSYRSMLGLAVALAALTPAKATKYTYIVTGTTTDDVDDLYFGYEGATLPIGAAFTLTYVLDDAVPTASYAYGANVSSATGVGAYNNGAVPPITATIAVGGYSYTVRQGDFYLPFQFSDIDGAGGIYEDDRGTAIKSTRTLKLDARYSYTESCCGFFFDYSNISSDELFVDLKSTRFTSSDFREPGTFALDPGSTGFFLTADLRSGDDVSLTYVSAGLSATSLTVTSDAVPEPSSWTALALGFGVMGSAIRRRSRPPFAKTAR